MSYSPGVAEVKMRSTPRAQQAAQTRHRILSAAGRVFEQQGFAGARVEDVAAEAGVAVPTVYKAFANKVNLLGGALAQAMTGGDAEAQVDEQPWWQEQLEEPDAARQLGMVARNARAINERAGVLLEVLRGAAALDATLAAASQEAAASRLARSRRTARSLATKGKDRL